MNLNPNTSVGQANLMNRHHTERREARRAAGRFLPGGAVGTANAQLMYNKARRVLREAEKRAKEILSEAEDHLNKARILHEQWTNATEEQANAVSSTEGE